MALEAYLTFTSSGGSQTDKLKLLTCEFGFTQGIDETGKPASRPQGGMIHLTIESTDKDTIAEWMFSQMGIKDGRIEFPLRNNKKKILSFEDGVCVSYNESYNNASSIPMLIRFTISANVIQLGTASFKNDWKKV